MASLLRQIVAGPRARHAEAGLDLCYVTDHIIATSGPSGTYPQRAYRNPLDSLVKFLDEKHGQEWAIWEFRAEGTGYPDSDVYNRIYHYPFPDHHPPPFALIPNIVASMRNWLHANKERVVVVHCKAGKGRSGTASCSYLISEEGWTVQKALDRFTERRMRPNMGKGVSIPSQLRWIGYVERWGKHGKLYVERQVEVLEVHCWGLRDGVKVQIEGFVEDGKKIKSFHVFTDEERKIVRGDVKTTGMAQVVQEVMYKNGFGVSASKKDNKPAHLTPDGSIDSSSLSEQALEKVTTATEASQESLPLGTGYVVFHPTHRVVLPTNDINVDIERRNKTAFDLTMVTAVAHVWFNTYFEGNGPEQDGNADQSGTFEIGWGAMDGIKGSSRKGTQAFERIAVVWRALSAEEGHSGVLITEPKEGEEVKQSSPANWRGARDVEPNEGKDLGVRSASLSSSSSSSSKRRRHEDATDKHKVNIPESDGMDITHDEMQGIAGEEILQQSAGMDGKEGGESAVTSSPVSQRDGPVDTKERPKPQEEQDPDLHGHGNIVDRLAEGIRHGLKYHVSGAASTGDLPDGRAESEMETPKEHALGHIRREKAKTNQ